MRLFEHEAKHILANFDIDVPRGYRAATHAEAAHAARRVGGNVYIKAQVASGGRMKAGGVRAANSPEDADIVARLVLAADLDGALVDGLLVEEALDVDHELYAGIVFDDATRQPMVIVSLDGGINVEDGDPSRMCRMALSSLLPTQNFRMKECLTALGIEGRDLVTLATILSRLFRAFVHHDLLLAEINPLARLTDGRWVALDCHMEIDADAVFRQDTLLHELAVDPAARTSHGGTRLEREAAEIDRSDHRGVAGRLVEFDGELGLLIGGGGASLTAFDAIRAHGGKPANYCEIGGNPSVRKVAALTELLLAQPGVHRLAVIMNVVNNTRADIIARGVIKGCIGAGYVPSDTITVFRVPGAWEDEAALVLGAHGVRWCDRTVSLDRAAALASGK